LLHCWRLSALPFASDFSRAAGFGLLIAGHIWGILNFLKYLCREQGVAQVHFRWHNVTRLALRRQLLWLKPLWVSLIFLIAIITFVGARNLPGVLEITLLKYVPLDAGAR